MPPTRSHIRDLVAAYLGRHPDERSGLAPLLSALDADDEPSARSTLPGHITCSAAVIDHRRRVLHVRHNASGGLLLAPGGHVEPDDATLLATAVREVHEETGIPAAQLCHTTAFCHDPADIDVHPVDSNPAKGEAAHCHYDFRFVFHLVPKVAETTVQAEEVSATAWLPLDQVTSPTLRAKLLAAPLDTGPGPVNASALIHDGHGRYLLHLRDFREGIWEPGVFALLGGGRTVDDPSLEATLHRELAEEVPGLEPTGLVPYTVEETTSIDGLTVPVQVYEGRWHGDPAAIDLREGVLLQWFAVDAIDRLRLSSGLGDLIRRHAAQHPAAGPPPGSSRLLPHEAPRGTEPHIVGVHLHLQHGDGRILLGLRHSASAYGGGAWHALAGHCEREEAISCLVREAREEAGLIIEPDDVELVHLVHVVDSPTARPRIQLFFRARSWSGFPQVLEPDRCLEWRWWDPKDLPAEVVPYTRQAIEGVIAGRLYSNMGWTR